MRILVQGLWHLGCVTAACLAAAHDSVVGLDFDTALISSLSSGRTPISEPGLDALVRSGLESGALRFTADATDAVATADVICVTYDTPVDDGDNADVAFVLDQVMRIFPFVKPGAVVLISSQLPVGSTRALAEAFRAARPGVAVDFAYSPENLRLSKAIDVFRNPERVVVGCDEGARPVIAALLAPVTNAPILWMSVESAEMTKHALNAFLACSVVFINELAVICEHTGADAKDVERGLKSDSRIGQKAYLSPGSAFAGGTLARDIQFLNSVAASRGVPSHLFKAIRQSNDAHRGWSARRLAAYLDTVQSDTPPTIAVWGLTYKPGTDTLRRSSSVELCQWIASRGAHVQAHDPAVTSLPSDVLGDIVLSPTPEAALAGASALVVATEWPLYRTIPAEAVIAAMQCPVVLDASRFTAKSLGSHPGILYFAVGAPA